MSPAFSIDHRELARDSRGQALADELCDGTRIDSPESFNRYCQTAIRAWRAQFDSQPLAARSEQWRTLLGQIAERGPSVIPTGWGGVVITLHEHPRVEKYLVVRQGGYLALEKHAEKDEHLEVREGAGLLLWRAGEPGTLLAQMLAPGDRFHFPPGLEHCLIGTADLLVFERSVDPKGMDQDLIFLYEPAAADPPL